MEKPAIRTVVAPMVLESHKNKLRPRRDGKGYYLDMKVRKQREALMLYLRQLTPIDKAFAVHCEIDVDLEAVETAVTLVPHDLYTLKRHPDLDGQAVAVLDACQKAGVIFNDNRIVDLIVRIK